MNPKTIALIAIAVAACAIPMHAQNPDSLELARLHEELLQAHRSGDVAQWMAIESAGFTSVNGGRVSFPSVEQRRDARTRYLGSARFEIYADLRPPIIEVSADGTLGWVIAEVEVKGQESRAANSPRFHDIWAWVELYRKVDGNWTMTGNASNRREPPGGDKR